jgi:hypothetical protein
MAAQSKILDFSLLAAGRPVNIASIADRSRPTGSSSPSGLPAPRNPLCVRQRSIPGNALARHPCPSLQTAAQNGRSRFGIRRRV